MPLAMDVVVLRAHDNNREVRYKAGDTPPPEDARYIQNPEAWVGGVVPYVAYPTPIEDAVARAIGPETELDYAENITGVSIFTHADDLTPVDMTGLVVVVPASARPVWFHLGATAVQTSGPVNIFPTVTEIDNGIDDPVSLPGIGQMLGAAYIQLNHIVRLGPTLRERMFKASWQKQGGAAYAEALTSGGYKAFLTAFAR